MKRTFSAAAFAALSATAHAGVSAYVAPGLTAYVTAGPLSSAPGVCTVDFDGQGAMNACSSANVSYGGLSPNSLRNGSVADVAAQPVGSTGRYLTLGPTDGSPITITLAPGTPANYFGFLAGSLDDYNSVTFRLVNGAMQSVTYSGTEIATLADFAADGNRGLSTYFNLRLDDGVYYDRITLASGANAFETDNHAFGVVASRIPAPGGIALVGAGFVAMGLAIGRRRG